MRVCLFDWMNTNLENDTILFVVTLPPILKSWFQLKRCLQVLTQALHGKDATEMLSKSRICPSVIVAVLHQAQCMFVFILIETHG